MQCQQNEWEQKQMEEIPYAFVVGSLMHAKHARGPTLVFQLVC